MKHLPHLLLKLFQLLIYLHRRLQIIIKRLHHTLIIIGLHLYLYLRHAAAARGLPPPTLRRLLFPATPHGAADQAGGDLVEDQNQDTADRAGQAAAYTGEIRRGFPDELAGAGETEAAAAAGGGGGPPETVVAGHDRKTVVRTYGLISWVT